MATGVVSWSQTAATNATADSTVNWAEGQAPSTLNDSARAMMASTAKWRDDIAGAISTGGTSTAFTVSSYQGFGSLSAMNGQVIAFVPNSTSGATVTLNVDSLGAKPLRFAPSVELPAGTLIQGTPYVATYNNSDGAFYLQNCFGNNPYFIPIGGIIPYGGSTAPNSNFALCYGQAISSTTYATLSSLLGTSFGTSAGNVVLPDLRGRAIFGQDNMGGSAASRVTTAGSSIDGTTIGAHGGGQTQTLITANLPPYTPAGSVATSTTNHTGDTSTGVSVNTPGSNVVPLGAVIPTITSTFTGTAQGGTSTPVIIMPPSIILPYIIRVI